MLQSNIAAALRMSWLYLGVAAGYAVLAMLIDAALPPLEDGSPASSSWLFIGFGTIVGTFVSVTLSVSWFR